MEYRKLIGFGKSSSIITLPKSWIKKNNLEKGDLIYIDENPFNELVLSSKQNLKKQKKEIIINIDGLTTDTIERKIISSYINNYTLIKIKGKKVKKEMPKIREVIKKLVAIEIMEQTSESIIIKDFLNLEDISLTNIIRRMDIITKSMVNDVNLVKVESQKDYIYERDTDVNSLFYLGQKTIKAVMDNPSMVKIMNINYKTLLNYWTIIDNIEHVADNIKRFVRLLEKLNFKSKQTKNVFESLVDLFNEITKEYDTAMKSYYTNDKKLADNVLAKKKSLIKKCNHFMEKHPGVYVARAIDLLKDFESHLNHIAKVVFSDY